MTDEAAFWKFLGSSAGIKATVQLRNCEIAESDFAQVIWQAAIAYMQEKSEPVAWAWKARQPNGQILQRVEMWNPISKHVPIDSYTVFDVTPLFTSPSKRKWKSLSEEQILKIGKNLATMLPNPSIDLDYANAIMDEMERINK